MMPSLELDVDRIATGGSGLGVAPDGRVTFVAGALPGERVRADVTADRATRIDAAVAEILTPSPDRSVPACPHLADGCGGCDWQHAVPDLQRRLRRDIVIDCLTRLAKIDDPDVRLGPVLSATGYRTTIRAAVANGSAGYRAGRSHRVVDVDACLVAHPGAEELLASGRFGLAREVTIRIGTRTGERVVVVDPSAVGVDVAGDTTVVGTDELKAGRQVHYHEEIAGRRLRISARSFFQCRPDGAEALVAAVDAALDDALEPGGRLLDAYCGVGLFGATIGAARDVEVVGVESSRDAADDAIVNYESALGPDRASVARVRFERWRPESFTAVVADPARVGLGRKAAGRLAATGAEAIALVSCEPAALARDARLLIDLGYRFDHTVTIDLFGHTSHVETVSRFVRRR